MIYIYIHTYLHLLPCRFFFWGALCVLSYLMCTLYTKFHSNLVSYTSYYEEGSSHLGNTKHSIFPKQNFIILEIWIISYPHETKNQIGIWNIYVTTIFQPFQFTPFFGGENKSVKPILRVTSGHRRLLVTTSHSPCKAKDQVHQVTSP